MDEYSIFHKINFTLVSIFVTLVGCSFLFGSIIYGLVIVQPLFFYFEIMLYSIEFFFRFFILPLIIILLFFYILVKIAFFYFRTAKLFRGEIDDCWEAFSRLIYRDSVLFFLFGLFIMIISTTFTGISEEMGVSTGTNILIDSFKYAFICIAISIFLVFSGNMIYNKSILGGIILIFRNLIRLVILSFLAIIYVSILSFLPAGSLLFIMIIILLDGISHLVASCLLVYYEVKDNQFSKVEENDYYSQYGLSPFSENIVIDDEIINNNTPNTSLRGEFDEDGFEWIEYPKSSEKWYWREQIFDDWQKH